jgi:hypothetical protein
MHKENIMKLSIISPTEKDLLKQIENSNDSDVALWRISNVLIPILTILISLVCFALFKPSNSKSWLSFLNLIVNGAIPMIALNRIGGMGIYLFKYDRSKEKQYGMTDTFFLRTKLFFWFLILVIGTIILYVYQVLSAPFSFTYSIFIIVICSIASLYFSINLSKKVYLLQDKLIDRTFEQDIRDDMKEKGHGKNWD